LLNSDNISFVKIKKYISNQNDNNLCNITFVYTNILQILIGYKVLKRKRKTSFILFSIFNILLEFFLTFVSFILAIRGISAAGNKCATGAVAMFLFGFIAGMLLLAVIIVQFSINKNKVYKNTNHN